MLFGIQQNSTKNSLTLAIANQTVPLLAIADQTGPPLAIANQTDSLLANKTSLCQNSMRTVSARLKYETTIINIYFGHSFQSLA